MFDSHVLEFIAVAGSVFICFIVIKAIVRKVNEHYMPQEPDLVADDLSGQQ
jgi:hypothetical protein